MCLFLALPHLLRFGLMTDCMPNIGINDVSWHSRSQYVLYTSVGSAFKRWSFYTTTAWFIETSRATTFSLAWTAASNSVSLCQRLVCCVVVSWIDSSRRYFGVIYLASGMPSVLRCCWLGITKSIRPVKIKWWGVGVVICLEWDADCLQMVQMMPLRPKTLSSLFFFVYFLLCDAMLVRYMLLLCICPSQTSIVLKRLDESSWFLAWELPITYPTLYYKEIWVSPKLGFRLELCPKLCHDKSIALSTEFVVINGWACWRHLYSNRRVVVVYCLLYVDEL